MSDRRAAVLLLAALASLGLCAFSGWWALVGICLCCVLLAPVLRTAHPDVPSVRAHGIEFSGCEQPPEPPTRSRIRPVSRVGDNRILRTIVVLLAVSVGCWVFAFTVIACQPPDDSGTDGVVQPTSEGETDSGSQP